MVYKWEHRQIARTKYDLRELPVAYATLYALTTSGAKYSFAKGHVEFPAVQFARPVRYMPGSNKRPTAKFASAEFHHRKGRMAFCLPGELVVIQGDVACQAGLKPGLAEWLANLAGVPA
jgi:hypothetical protein